MSVHRNAQGKDTTKNPRSTLSLCMQRTAKRFGEKYVICSLLHQFNVKHTEDNLVHNIIKIIFLDEIMNPFETQYLQPFLYGLYGFTCV